MIDLVNIRITSGHGGNGASGFHREKFVSRGGPDGGDGGKGGDVIFEADNGLTTLAHFRHARLYKAEPGVNGAANKMHGAGGNDLVLKVPAGTVIKSDDGSKVWDIDTPGLRVVVARGGDGGRGNARFANSIRQAPHFAEKGMPGEYLDLQLELKLLADVGLVGLPNAGKSTLIRAVSRATPDVADFPFTTLEPVLGVVDLGVEAFVMADLPGLIEGAHEGVGLGIQFLRHVERTRVLVHVLDAGSEDPIADYETIRHELEQYGGGLAEKPEIVALNKIDLSETREAAEKLEGHLGKETLLVSGATGEGTRTLMTRLQQLLHETAPEPVAISETRPILRPKGRDRLEVVQDGDVYVVSGERAEQAALKLGEQGEEALDELQDRLRRMGLDKMIRRIGGRPGDTIRVGGIDSRVVRMKIGFLGGTFDPPHVGHLIFAEIARQQLELDKVLFIPAGDPWRKADRYVTPSSHRLAMTRLAIADNAAFELDDLEVRREGATYTVDTLRELRSRLRPDDVLVFLAGQDALADMPHWRDPAGIAEAAVIAIAPREGAALPVGLPFDTTALPRIQMPFIDISSTSLRQRATEGLSLRYLVPPAVEAYIRDNGLYRQT